MLRYLLMEKCKNASSRLRKRYAFSLFKAVTRSPDDEINQYNSAISGRASPHGEFNEILNQSAISVHNKSGSRHLSKSGETPMVEKDLDWYDLFWAKHRQELNVDTYKYKSGE